MRIVEWSVLVDDGYSSTSEFRRVETDIARAIGAVVWPPGSGSFAVRPLRQGNGVKPIKEAFVTSLELNGWIAEHDRFDAHFTFPSGSSLPFVVEWETGNISSSHRAINRMALGMLEGRVAGGVLVLPTRALYHFLTDRVGNYEELSPYFPLWGGVAGRRPVRLSGGRRGGA